MKRSFAMRGVYGLPYATSDIGNVAVSCVHSERQMQLLLTGIYQISENHTCHYAMDIVMLSPLLPSPDHNALLFSTPNAQSSPPLTKTPLPTLHPFTKKHHVITVSPHPKPKKRIYKEHCTSLHFISSPDA